MTAKLSIASALGFFAAFPCQAYIRTQTGSGVPLVRTDAASIATFVNSSLKAGFTNSTGQVAITASSDPMSAIAAAEAQWSAVPTAAVTFAPPAPTTLSNNPNDNIFVLTIEDTPENRSVVGSYLAITLWTYAEDGSLLDTDIIYNPAQSFSTDGSAGSYDLQSLTAHELGHSLGAGHSPLIGATMFQAQGPFANYDTFSETTLHRTLSADDVAFVSAAYPSGTIAGANGTLEGRVAFLDGSAVVGALVGAANPSAGLVYGAIASLVDGTFRFDQLPPGNYFVYAHPANGPVAPANILLPGIANANTTFRTTFAGGNPTPATFAITAGQTARANIAVDPAPSAMHIDFLGAGSGAGDYSYLENGPRARNSGQAFELDLWGSGLPATTTESQILLLGQGITLHPGTLSAAPGRIQQGLTPLVFTVDSLPNANTSLVTVAVLNGSDGTVSSGGLALIGTASAPACSVALSTKTFQSPASGTTSTLNITEPAGCSWTASSSAPWLHAITAAGAGNSPVQFSVDANTAPAIRTGTLTISGQTVSIQQTGTLGVPTIGAVVDAASNLPQVAPGSFVTIYGTNLSIQSMPWDSAIQGGVLPTQLAGVSVQINGADCFISYVSPTQVNLLVPPDISPAGNFIQLTGPSGITATTFSLATVAPGFFVYPANGHSYAAAVFANTPTLVAAAHPASSGSVLELFLNGLGPTDGFYPIGRVLTTSYPLTKSPATLTIAGVSTTLLFTGMTYAGLYQVNAVVPAGVPAGDQPLVLTIDGLSTGPAFLPFTGR